MASLTTERDAGFCSGGDEDEGFYSHTDASDDSADLRVRNKRKCCEPRRLETELPAKKRKIDLLNATINPFRPWSPQPPSNSRVSMSPPLPSSSIRTPCQNEPLPLLTKKRPKRFDFESAEERLSQDVAKTNKQSSQQAQRNYKNMTRERRIEANARERTRVHTISAAFDTLRSSIPAYSHNQKLSKLSVLRIACSYIVTLSKLSGQDASGAGSASQSENMPSLSQCVSDVSRTIQTEGKVRKKKDE